MEFFDFKTSENVALNGWMIKPSGPEFQNKQLPVLMYVYGGPGSQQVTDSWKSANYWWFKCLPSARLCSCLCGQTTWNRSQRRGNLKDDYKQLGHYEVLDQIGAAKYLEAPCHLSILEDRLLAGAMAAIWRAIAFLKGWCVLKAAIAVAPVTNWNGTTRCTPSATCKNTKKTNRIRRNSPVNFAGKLNSNYLLIHGLGWRQCAFQHTAEMANQLIAKDKQFDTMIYQTGATAFPTATPAFIWKLRKMEKQRKTVRLKRFD